MALQVRGIVIRFSANSADFPLLHTVHAGPEAHQTSFQWIFGYIFLGLKLEGRETDHSLLSSAES